jgi:hypothetical protein
MMVVRKQRQENRSQRRNAFISGLGAATDHVFVYDRTHRHVLRASVLRFLPPATISASPCRRGREIAISRVYQGRISAVDLDLLASPLQPSVQPRRFYTYARAARSTRCLAIRSRRYRPTWQLISLNGVSRMRTGSKRDPIQNQGLYCSPMSARPGDYWRTLSLPCGRIST